LDKAVELPPVPVIAKKKIKTGLGTVEPGKVAGLTSKAFAKKDGKEVITLEFCAHANVKKEYDEILIKGLPNIHEKIIGGVHGDIGTVAVTINTIPRAVKAPAGLLVMKDLPPAIATS
jgi:4-hydroxy-tetrahydrodipicolinate reductase